MANGNLQKGSRINMRGASVQNGRGSVVKVVRSVLDSRIEHKRITAVGALADLATAGVVNTISMAVTQGDGIGNRSGNVIRPVSLKIRVQMGQLAGNYDSFVARFIIFQDTMCNGSTPAVTDLLSSADPLSGYEPETRQARRFKVLHDRTLTLTGQTKNNRRYLSVDLPMKGAIHYLASTGAATDQGKNSIFALFITSAAAAGGNRYGWSYDFEFTDA